MRFSVSKAGLFYSPPIFEMQIYKNINTYANQA